MADFDLQVQQTAGLISFNFEELNRQLDMVLADYEGAVFTDDTMDIAKKERAKLRKLKSNLNSERIDVKNAWMAPYTEFEDKVKKLSAKIDKPINLIDEQVKAYEEKKREEKREAISQMYEQDVDDDIKEYLPLDKIFSDKWLNVSASMKSIEGEILDKADEVKADIASIKAMPSEAVNDALKVYKKNLNCSEAIKYIGDYERRKTEILEREKKRKEEEERRKAEAEERKRREQAEAEERERQRKERKAEEAKRREIEAAAEKARAEERAKIEAEKAAAAKEEESGFDVPEEETGFEVAEPVEGFTDEELPFEQSNTITAYYKVIATEEELENVEMAFNSIGIYFERKEKEL